MTAERSLTIAQVASLLAPQRPLLILIAVIVLASAGLEVAPPLIVRSVLDTQLAAGGGDNLLALGGLYLLAVAGAQGLGFGSGYLTAIAAQNALRALRIRLFAHLQRLPTRYFDVTPLGDIISRCTADIDTIDTLFSSGIANLIADMARLATIALTMLVLSPALTLIAALSVPPLLALTSVIQRRVLRAERANRRAVGALNTELQQTLGGAEMIRAFGQAEFFSLRFRARLQDTLNAYVSASRYSAVYTPLMVVLAALIVTVLLFAGAQGALAGWGITIGALAAFVLLFRRFFTPIAALGEEWQTVQSALSGAERVFQVLSLPADAPPADRPAGEVRPLRDDAPLIELKNVTFGYIEDRPVLRGVSLSVRAGEHVALVGRTGAGKTSIAHLAGGLYGPWSGVARVAGADPRGMTDDTRRHLLGVVPQMLQLFTGSVRDNLTMGDPSIPQAAVEAAAIAAGAHAFISALPDGYDTGLGAGNAGAPLSAGQRQQLALARALVRQPAVLLLDEATAAIDHASDAAFRAALRNDAATSRRAVLIIAHRLATAREADRVLVVEDGRILEEGTPDDLVKRGGRFAALLELEAAGWDWKSA